MRSRGCRVSRVIDEVSEFCLNGGMANADNLNALVGERVHQVMWRQRVTQTELAAALGVDQAAVNRRLRGKTSWKLHEVFKAAEVLGVEVGELFPNLSPARKEANAESKCSLPLGQLNPLRRVQVTSGFGRGALRPVSCAS